ncbi:MAG TPA: SpoIID/LytB domain-containing protein [Candidatus Galloscillospira excrementipullorum]|nr:SpoIID/LytB domain-containing protein [Candidatus Galloscillospira excrementipullorum]
MYRKLFFIFLLTGLLAFCAPYAARRLQQRAAAQEVLAASAQPEAVETADLLVNVWLVEEDVCQSVALEQYLAGVVAAEMPLSSEPAALQAQAVAARSYLLSKLGTASHENGADICTDSTHCLAWRAPDPQADTAAFEAVSATSGQVLTYGDAVAQTVFCAMTGELTESAAEIWGSSSMPYLTNVPSPGDAQQEDYVTTVTMSPEQFWQAVSPLSPDTEAAPLVVLRRSAGDTVLSCTVGGVQTTGQELRGLLGLRSARFWLDYEGDALCFTVKGYGHGVGMSQAGAQVMAQSGSTYAEILAAYYPGCTLCKITF